MQMSCGGSHLQGLLLCVYCDGVPQVSGALLIFRKVLFSFCCELNICVPQAPSNSYTEALIPNVVVIGGGAFGR